MMVKKLGIILASALAIFTTNAANATTLLYTLTPTGGGPVYSFALAEQPTPSAYSAMGFIVRNVHVQVGTLSEIRKLVFLTMGGLQIRNKSVVELSLDAAPSPKLFDVVPVDPTLKSGDFALNGTSGAYSLHVAAPLHAAAVPEPATWGMMILGMGLVGGVLRRRSKSRLALA